MKFLVFAASHRKESLNGKLAALAAQWLEAQGHVADMPFYGAFDLPLYNDDIARRQLPDAAYIFARRAQPAHGIIICSPEYNWSYPGSLKNILDWTSRIEPAPLAGKTALLMSATPGARGGILGLNHLKTPLEALQLHVYNRVFPLGNAENAFDGKGQLAQPKQQQMLIALLAEYVLFTQKFSA